MKIRFLFYKAKCDGKLLDNAISSWTWLLALARLDFKNLRHNYSHVEAWFPDENGRFIKWKGAYDWGWNFEPVGQCFSSTTRGDAEGVRFAPASEVLKHPERWDYQEFEVDDIIVKIWMKYFEAWVGKKYDYPGIFGLFTPFNIQDLNKWYDSEICAWVAESFEILHKSYYRISPRRLAKVLSGEIKPLKILK